MSKLTPSGLQVDTVSEIKSRIDEASKSALGSVNIEPDSVIGQYNGIIASEIALLTQTMQDVYDSMYARSSEGTSLDGAVAFAGIERNPSSSTKVYAVCYGLDGTTIPSGRLVRADVQYTNKQEGTISRLIAIDSYIAINGIVPKGLYQLSIDSKVISYTAGSTTSSPEIISGIVNEINSAGIKNVIASISDNLVNIRSVNLIDSFQVRPIALTELVKIGSNIRFECTQNGNIKLPTNSLVSIDTPVVGWQSVNNLMQGSSGSDVESDQSLRLRYGASGAGTGFATEQAIKKWLLTVPGVSSARIYQNRSMYQDQSGMPAHSIECIVTGGFDFEIAEMIDRVKGAGIETHGNKQVIVIDENGDGQPVKFSRSVSAFIWVKVEVLALDYEQQLQPNTPELIANSVMETGYSIAQSDDVIIQKFIGPIYKATTGIGYMKISMALTMSENDAPVYSESNIAISREQIATFDKTRIMVSGL